VTSCETSAQKLAIKNLLRLEREFSFDEIVYWPLDEAPFRLAD
jgi:hypothetical protein